jgi:predicted RNase H-like HicB family nuclease
MATVVRVQAKIQWQCCHAAGGNWVGVCDPLKLTVQAETWADLMEDIGLTLDAVMKDLLTSNELPKFLVDRGWTLLGPIPNTREDVRFDVPFIPAMMGARGPQAELYQ